jgi:hypothetical protein
MKNTEFTVGQRVDVDFIRTETWHSEKYIRNGIVRRITEAGQVVVSIDNLSKHSHNFTGGCLYPSAYNIKSRSFETSFEICGFWYHIMWDGNIGFDSMGGKWTNPEIPTPEDPELINRLLDAYNNVKDKMSS